MRMLLLTVLCASLFTVACKKPATSEVAPATEVTTTETTPTDNVAVAPVATDNTATKTGN